jgi:hypothetical protein
MLSGSDSCIRRTRMFTLLVAPQSWQCCGRLVRKTGHNSFGWKAMDSQHEWLEMIVFCAWLWVWMTPPKSCVYGYP